MVQASGKNKYEIYDYRVNPETRRRRQLAHPLEEQTTPTFVVQG